MVPEKRTVVAARLMSEFALRTGLSPPAQHPQRYLWTDAFAVCNFLELFARTGDQSYRRCAASLIEQVHRVLGQFRDDDVRQGWISGLEEETGSRHPTIGGLRIGKPLRERAAHEEMDERLEWDRDGQYFHYLTKWMHALCQASFALDEPHYASWAVQLGEAAFKGFVRNSRSGEVIGVYWKMSTDLARPLVAASGLHDALDGFITFREARHASTSLLGQAACELDGGIAAFEELCENKDWSTDDPLGLGGLLFDACGLSLLMIEPNDVRFLETLLDSCRTGLAMLVAQRQLQRPAFYRLAFRELGLAIGLSAIPIIARQTRTFPISPAAQSSIDFLASSASLGEDILAFWLPETQRQQKNWRDHQDINDVMLATTLIPEAFLRIAAHRLGGRQPM
jgi:hypothetical protein